MTHKELIKHLIDSGVLESSEIIKAFEKIDRTDFILEKDKTSAYEDNPLSIGYGQTISQPYTVAFILELLKPEKGEKILDIGSGSGWTTALLSEITGKEGKVIGMEIIPELVRFGKANLEKYAFSQAEIIKAGEILGAPENAPFDKILVSATTDEGVIQELARQLKISGVLVIPIHDSIWKVSKIGEEDLKIEKHFGFSFVPLKRMV